MNSEGRVRETESKMNLLFTDSVCKCLPPPGMGQVSPSAELGIPSGSLTWIMGTQVMLNHLMSSRVHMNMMLDKK